MRDPWDIGDEYYPQCACFSSALTQSEARRIMYSMAETLAEMITSVAQQANLCTTSVPHLLSLIVHQTLCATAVTELGRRAEEGSAPLAGTESGRVEYLRVLLASVSVTSEQIDALSARARLLLSPGGTLAN